MISLFSNHRNGDAKTKQVATEVYDALSQTQEQKQSNANR